MALLLLALGIGIEVGQSLLLPKRTFDWLDFGGDALGVFLGWIFVEIFLKKRL